MSSERTSGVAWTSALPFAKRSAFGSTSTRLRLEPTHCLPAGVETGRNRGVRTLTLDVLLVTISAAVFWS
jgi:hypothetical protein